MSTPVSVGVLPLSVDYDVIEDSFPELATIYQKQTRDNWEARRYKGGPGSGHHGHAGIPGEQGGSLPRNVAMSRRGRGKWLESIIARGQRIANKWAEKIQKERQKAHPDIEVIRQLYILGGEEIKALHDDELGDLESLAQEVLSQTGSTNKTYLNVVALRSWHERVMQEATGAMLTDGLRVKDSLNMGIDATGLDSAMMEDKVLLIARDVLGIIPDNVVDNNIENPYGDGRSWELIIAETNPWNPHISYSPDDDMIFVHPTHEGLQSTLSHELGHWLTTRIPGAAERYNRLFRKLTRGKSPLNHYNGYEYFAGSFPDPYMGRTYSEAGYSLLGIEIPSVVLEWMYTGRAVTMAKEYPEIFNTVLSTITGMPLYLPEEYRQGRMPWADKARRRYKGGKGSGHHGHSGRPGERGGSVPGDVAMSRTTGRAAVDRRDESGLRDIAVKHTAILQEMVKRRASVEEIREAVENAHFDVYENLPDHRKTDALRMMGSMIGDKGAVGEAIDAVKEYGSLEAIRAKYIRQIVLNGLKAENPYITPVEFAGPPGEDEERKVEIVQAVTGIVPADVVDDSMPNPFPGAFRGPRELFIVMDNNTRHAGYYDHETDSIAYNPSVASPDYIEETLVHETGHWLTARIPGALQTLNKEHARRTSGDKAFKMFGSYVKADQFFDPYMGRIRNPGVSDKGDGCEILSVFCQSVWNGTIGEFAREDAESFDLSLSILTGLPRSAQKGGEGSGHHGHRGRPGERGGSLPGNRGETPEKTENQKLAEKIQAVRSPSFADVEMSTKRAIMFRDGSVMWAGPGKAMLHTPMYAKALLEANIDRGKLNPMEKKLLNTAILRAQEVARNNFGEDSLVEEAAKKFLGAFSLEWDETGVSRLNRAFRLIGEHDADASEAKRLFRVAQRLYDKGYIDNHEYPTTIVMSSGRYGAFDTYALPLMAGIREQGGDGWVEIMKQAKASRVQSNVSGSSKKG